MANDKRLSIDNLPKISHWFCGGLGWFGVVCGGLGFAVVCGNSTVPWGGALNKVVRLGNLISI